MFCFFFQAEDGIRDRLVTGVQTCALPILDASGTDEFMRILNNKLAKENVFVISHKGDTLIDKFPSILKFEKYKNFKIDDYFESLIDIVLPEGTIAFPTFNFDFNNGLLFDYFNTKSKMGSLTEFARLSKISYRTLNPVYSFSIIGNFQKNFFGLDNVSWYSIESPFHIFRELNFKICILDLDDNSSMTFLHYCEEYFQVEYRYYKTFSGNYIGPDNLKRFKTYKGFVRKINEGIITYLQSCFRNFMEKKKYTRETNLLKKME